jgi:DNA recombination protein Rad52
MTFTVKQRRLLAAKLKHRHVKSRSSQGGSISYLEGWHVIAEANRIFGYDSWDRQTLYPRCIWSDRQASHTAVLYSTKVRITVRAGGEVITREGIGAGFGRAPSEEAAHEIALKSAETDATKRALATFGNSFGLALYDRDQVGVTRPTKKVSTNGPPLHLFVLCRHEGDQLSFQTPQAFADAAFVEIRKIERAEDLYAFARRNRETIVQLRSLGKGMEVLANAIRLVLVARANVLSQRPSLPPPRHQAQTHEKFADGELAFPKERRIRNKEHLQFVARQPCLICGRRPTHAHHVRFAQRRALGMKVSDEFTVPLCSVHHDALHRASDERRWWARQAIDPLKTAGQLWAVTLRGVPEQDDVSARQSEDAPPSSVSDGSTSGSEDSSKAHSAQ